ncbi:hypothetical protein C8R43DRAFT_1139929 [Mycena crocata]|nr:hypothetical protein C8R43DRAFT_1139929 [Mycena crocata]
MAIRRVVGISFTQERLKADYWAARPSTDLQAFVHSVRTEFAPQLGDAAAESEFSDVTSALIDAAISAFDSMALLLQKPVPSYTIVVHDIMAAVKPPAGITIAHYVDKVLVPSISSLKTFLATVGFDYRTDPFHTFCGAVIKAYANAMEGKKPHELVIGSELNGVGCSACSECSALRAFLEDKVSIDFSRLQNKRIHLDYRLCATTPWGVTWETHKSGSPHTPRITKFSLISGSLPMSSQKGMAPVAELGDDAAQ